MMITVVLIYKDNLYSADLDYDDEITFGSNKKDTVVINDFDKESIHVKFKDYKIKVNANKAYGIEIDDMTLNSYCDLDEGVRLFVGDVNSKSSKTYKIPYNALINVGRSSKNDFVISKPFVSGRHFILRSEAGIVHVEDLNSTNGLYLNGKRISKAIFKSGDVLQIYNVKILLQNGVLSFENVDDKLLINEIKSDFEEAQKTHNEGNNLVYKRSPRTQAKLPSEEIILAAPPTRATKQRKSRGMFASLAGTSAMMAAGVLTSASSPALIAARAAGLVSPIASVGSNRGMNKQNKKEYEEYELKRREKYGDYIDDQKAKIEKIASLQREIITQENPSPLDCASVLFGLKKTLWERSTYDNDFLKVRLGMGYSNLCVKVKAPNESNSLQLESDEVRELTGQIIEETRIVDNIPSCISLMESNTIGFIGDRNKNIRIVKNVLTELVTSHCFSDVKIIGVFDESEKKEWESLRWLPHVSSDNKEARYLSFDQDGAHAICEMLEDIIKKRREDLGTVNSYAKPPVPKPYYIVIFGSKEIAEKEEVMTALFDNNPGIGVTSFFMFNDIYNLPLDCRFIIDSNNGPCFYEKNEINNKFYFTIDEGLNNERFDLFTRRMSAIELDGFAVKAPIPNGVTFLEGFGVKKVEELNSLARWESSNTFESLAAPVGVLEGNKIFNLDIYETAHGPHGLVAGTTGSGKSEMLQSWILSMCVNYHPHDVNFVIIDYKGGGMANLLEPLPHVTGKITNIGTNIKRTLLSLKSENKRRQRLFDEYGVNNIKKYQKLYKEGKTQIPIPHLVIVADEFAELKKEEPDFMAELVSTARVGRSLGVHLVLATQKPGGIVDDQIQSNSRFRLCLKVADAADSREMIKVPDAARITQAGRCFVRVGEDEVFDLFQSFYSGAPYSEDETEIVVNNKVEIVSTNGAVFKIKEEKKQKNPDSIDELTAVVNYLKKLAEDNGIKKLQGPWLDPLSNEIYLSDVLHEGEPLKWLQVPIGMYDIPVAQSQGVMNMDFAVDGHYGIYGAPGTGKTTFLKTMVMSICANYKPSDVCVYLLDFGGCGLGVLQDLPHVGGVAFEGEDEKFQKFESLITKEIEDRKKLFLKNMVGSLSQYRETVADDIPAIVIGIDNIGSLFEAYADMETLFTTIATSGTTYGIYLAYTSSTTTGVKYKIMQNTKGAVAFELADKGDYTTLVGRLEDVAIPKSLGRALFKSNTPIEFQTAIYADGDNDRDRALNIKKIAEELLSNWDGPMPKKIPVMPEEVTTNDLIAGYTTRTNLPVGLSVKEVEPYCLDLKNNYCVLVSGSSGSGKSTLLSNLVSVIAAKQPETEFYIFDTESSPVQECKEVATKYAQTSEDEAIDEMLKELVEKLNTRKKAESIDDMNLICVVVDDLKVFVDAITDENRDTLERICRLAKGLGVIVLCAGRTNDMQKYSQIESLTMTVISSQKGILLDGTANDCTFFNNTLKYNEKDVEVGDGIAYVFDEGKCEKIKVVS